MASPSDAMTCAAYPSRPVLDVTPDQAAFARAFDLTHGHGTLSEAVELCAGRLTARKPTPARPDQDSPEA